MKKIEAVVRPAKAEEVRIALQEAGITGVMVTEIHGHGKQKGMVQQWRGDEYRLDLIPKVKLEVIAQDADLNKIVDVILRTAKTGEIGDGKIFISPVETVIRIRTGDTGPDAV